VQYETRYVAFLDILGFGEKVRLSERRPGDFGSLHELLSALSWRPSEGQVDQIDIQFQSFSDSIVVSTKASTAGLIGLLRNVSGLYVWMLERGMPTRGGVSKGSLFHDNSVMFGPAFLDAYHIEQTIAKYPRILPSRVVCEDFLAIEPLNDGEPWPALTMDDDGPPYLDVLERFSKINDADAAPTERESETANRCADALQRLINDAVYEPRYFEKLEWLGQKWNTTLRTIPGLPVKSRVKFVDILRGPISQRRGRTLSDVHFALKKRGLAVGGLSGPMSATHETATPATFVEADRSIYRVDWLSERGDGAGVVAAFHTAGFETAKIVG
jgi:hypothetical protein